MRTPIRRNQDLWGGFIENLWNDSQFFKNENVNRSSIPAVNIKNSENEFEIELAAPGLKKEDFSIEIEDNMLKLGVNKTQETEEKQENFTRKEFNYFSFQRNFSLPKNGIDTDKITASYTDGILKVVLPKLSEIKDTTKKIAVS